jgi:hypothetical protein
MQYDFYCNFKQKEFLSWMTELVDDCKNKRYMINFLDESRGRQD